jgi:hypothetical protein
MELIKASSKMPHFIKEKSRPREVKGLTLDYTTSKEQSKEGNWFLHSWSEHYKLYHNQ